MTDPADKPAYDCETMGHVAIAGEDNCRMCGNPYKLMCQVCERNPAVGVASSALGAVSLAYCHQCLEHHADADFMVENVLATCGSWDYVADWFKEHYHVWRATPGEPGAGEYVKVTEAYSEDDVHRLAREQDEWMRAEEAQMQAADAPDDDVIDA